MIRTLLIALAALIAALVVVVALQPSDFHIARTASISASAPAIFAQVNDFRNWQAWSPWEEIDPAMTRTYEGASSGTGAVYGWAGGAQVGEGRMTITERLHPHQARVSQALRGHPRRGVHVQTRRRQHRGDLEHEWHQ
jgi:hypothetical protein